MTKWRITTITIFLLSCWTTSCTPAQPSTQRLRLTNVSKVDIERVTVFFPGESVLFEKIAAESTTEYFEFAQGVYAYAAYEVTSGSQKFVQPVADWMGESPMAGNDFTYTIDFDPSRDQYDWIRVLQVVRDR